MKDKIAPCWSSEQFEAMFPSIVSGLKTTIQVFGGNPADFVLVVHALGELTRKMNEEFPEYTDQERIDATVAQVNLSWRQSQQACPPTNSHGGAG